MDYTTLKQARKSGETITNVDFETAIDDQTAFVESTSVEFAVKLAAFHNNPTDETKSAAGQAFIAREHATERLAKLYGWQAKALAAPIEPADVDVPDALPDDFDN